MALAADGTPASCRLTEGCRVRTGGGAGGVVCGTAARAVEALGHTAGRGVAAQVSIVLDNLLLALWKSNTSTASLKSDTTTVRRNMMLLTVLSVLIALSALLLLPLLPSQKAHIARLKQQPNSPLMGKFMLAFLALMMIGGTTLSCLPIFPGTACLVIAGGGGC